MNELDKYIASGDVVDVRNYLLNRLRDGNIFKFQVKNALDKIEKSPISDEIFLPFIESKKIKYNKSEWTLSYLKQLHNTSIATSKFDREFVLHMSDVSNHVYRFKHCCIVAGITLSIACVAVAITVAATQNLKK